MAKKEMVSVDELKKNIWLFDKKECRMTGRTAIKEYGRQKNFLFEIYYPNTMNSNTEKKWVRLEDLWHVRSASERVYIPRDLLDAVRQCVAED